MRKLRLLSLVVLLPLLGAWQVGGEDPEVKLREEVLAQALRSVVVRSCPAEGIPCCLAVPDGWVSSTFMKRLRGLPVRTNKVDPLLGECSGTLVSVRALEWVKTSGARVGIIVGMDSVGDRCSVSLERRDGHWTVAKTQCQFYSIM
jgi:hypothetical protein